jgi:DNA helicase HerA-like ATPase
MTEQIERIGEIIDVSGGSAVAILDAEILERVLMGEAGDGASAGQIGSIVRIHGGGVYIYAAIRTIRTMARDRHHSPGEGYTLIYADLDFIGQGEPAGENGEEIVFGRGISQFPIPGRPVSHATPRDIEAIFSPRGAAHVPIGTVYPHYVLPAAVRTDNMLSKHFALLGSTGTGKSSALALILHRLAEQMPHGHIIVLDPHNEYGGAFGENAERFDTDSLRLPYWLMDLDEHIEVFIGRNAEDRMVEADILKRCLLAARKQGGRSRQYRRITVNTPVPYVYSDLIELINTAMGKLEKPEKLVPYLRLKAKIEELKLDNRYRFMFSGLRVNDSLADILSGLLRLPVDGKPVSIIDLSGVPSDIVNVVVSVLCRTVFDFAVWSRHEQASPILLVCEEAHRYIPQSSDRNFDSARRSLERIAKEGRKYGVSLGIISQRPADLSESVLSQCGTIFALRMNNERDQKFVENVMPEGSGGFLAALPSLQNREAIVVGQGVNAPMRIQFDFLEEHRRPTSEDPCFSENWRHDTADRQTVQNTIDRWRTQDRQPKVSR